MKNIEQKMINAVIKNFNYKKAKRIQKRIGSYKYILNDIVLDENSIVIDEDDLFVTIKGHLWTIGRTRKNDSLFEDIDTDFLCWLLNKLNINYTSRDIETFATQHAFDETVPLFVINDTTDIEISANFAITDNTSDIFLELLMHSPDSYIETFHINRLKSGVNNIYLDAINDYLYMRDYDTLQKSDLLDLFDEYLDEMDYSATDAALNAEEFFEDMLSQLFMMKLLKINYK